MTRIARRRTMGGHDIRICGRLVNINLAKIVYKCEACCGGLERVGAGLRCENDASHRGFIHRDEVARLKYEQQENTEQLKDFYEVKNGKVVIK